MNHSMTTTHEERMQALRAREAERERQEAATPRQLFLPGFEHEKMGALPNDVNRSSLFAPVARGRRRWHRQAKMVTRSDCTLEYTGEQLDEADADIAMALIQFARPRPFAEPVPVNRAELLRFIGRGTGKTQYEWLHRRIKAMTEATMFLEAWRKNGTRRYSVGRYYGFHIIDKFELDEATGVYHFMLDARWIALFMGNNFALVDWDKRKELTRQDMAKALQRLIATDAATVQRYALDALKAQFTYAGRLRDFRQALDQACAELRRVGVIAEWKQGTSTTGREQLTLWRE